ncbi:hypothetical protein [Chengkuizengella sediminis]|uniref:hypothetical protein n=1 Tax=Chengkuizengella sediminis TaxID=1885917 RepID=UPI001389E93B|nr:hypothetical protein [Chengkuizengella sediminis]NDI33818.1 hypothetical protein [Chengkuizengella sediminis]
MKGHKSEMQLTIDHLVTVQEEIDKIVTGKKTTVRRHGKYAEVGEILTLEGQNYRIKDVFQQANKDMVDEDAIKEGYQNLEEYRISIQKHHNITTLKFNPEKYFWVHVLEKVKV